MRKVKREVTCFVSKPSVKSSDIESQQKRSSVKLFQDVSIITRLIKLSLDLAFHFKQVLVRVTLEEGMLHFVNRKKQ